MFSTLSELIGLVNKTLVVEYTRPSSSDIVKSEGTLLRAGTQGIVFESQGKTEIIPLTAIIDLYPFVPPRKVVRRKVQHLLPRRARQHLLDRHGFMWDLIKFTTDATAAEMHGRIDHKNLGHQHREPGDAAPDDTEEEEELG